MTPVESEVLEFKASFGDWKECIRVFAPIESILNELAGTREMSISELMDIVVMKYTGLFRKTYQNLALCAGFFERSFPDKPKSLLQKYRRRGWGRNNRMRTCLRLTQARGILESQL